MGKRVCEKEYLRRVEHFAFYRQSDSCMAKGMANFAGNFVLWFYYNVTRAWTFQSGSVI